MSIIALNFQWDQRPFQIRMDLDERHPNEKTILGFLKSGNFYEPDESNIMLTVLREGDTVIDVGANVGFFTVLAATLVGSKGHVVAFEPGVECVVRLRSNLALNDLGNVSLVEQVATNQVGEVTFFLNTDNSGGNALWDPGLLPNTGENRRILADCHDRPARSALKTNQDRSHIHRGVPADTPGTLQARWCKVERAARLFTARFAQQVIRRTSQYA
jgi:tRNA G37 N-methylase Trm5